MSTQLCQRSGPAPSNQFIRPTTLTVSIDTVSTAQRLASRGIEFETSNEVAASDAGGVATELADELMTPSWLMS
jgi:hypothetical protein